MKEALSALRFHIVAIAAAAATVFGYLFRDAYLPGVALVCGLDWCIVNLLNRATDVEEDRLNGIVATEWVAAHAKLVVVLSLVVLGVSLVVGFFVTTKELALTRVLFHALGLGYSFRYVPTPKGFARFKDLYAAKNGVSAFMFVLSVGLYPLFAEGGPRAMSLVAVAWLLGFFYFFEQSFEVLYDLRDLEGDTAVGVPTYPVVHGVETGGKIVVALCIGPALFLVLGRLVHVLTMREELMLAAPVGMLVFLRVRGASNVSRADCIGATYACALALVVYLVGTALWARAGLPRDF
jgi:4-hydroxybenzoate polyprenyltransferase